MASTTTTRVLAGWLTQFEASYPKAKIIVTDVEIALARSRHYRNYLGTDDKIAYAIAIGKRAEVYSPTEADILRIKASQMTVDSTPIEERIRRNKEEHGL